ncbi:MAG: site-specific integrase [Acidobacteria bacterium]|nr:site-specific integrase [Acidobacteriota bacterium]
MNRTRRYQRGYIYARNGRWVLRYCAQVNEDGQLKWKQPTYVLASICDRYPTRESVRALADEFLLELNTDRYNPQSTMTLRQFVDSHFFPQYGKQNWRPSVLKTDQWRWRKHLDAFCGDFRLRDFTPADGQRIINRLAVKGTLSRSSLQRVRGLLSAAFAEAKRQGALGNVPNPMEAVRIPRNGTRIKPPKQPHAYGLEEIKTMLLYLPEPDRTIAALLAFTGLRAGELAALEWSDWKDGYLHVWKSDWEGHVTDTKTNMERFVPVIPRLAEILETHRARLGTPKAGRIFKYKGQRISLRNRARVGRRLRRTLTQHEIAWHGWHAFRRGLATNLKALGVATLTIQAILGHRNPRTTETHYIKTRQPELDAAMKKLEAALTCTVSCTEGTSVAVN